MGKFTTRPRTIEAHRWFKNGDHPLDYSKAHEGLRNGEMSVFSSEKRKANNWEGDIVRYYRHPEVPGSSTCDHCGLTMHVHGFVETSSGGCAVCPGDWIITGDGEYYPCKPTTFVNNYVEVEDEHNKSGKS